MILNHDQIIAIVRMCGAIKPFDINQVQPASYDFRLGDRWAGYEMKKKEKRLFYGQGEDSEKDTYAYRESYLDLAKATTDLAYKETVAESHILYPGYSVLASTQEYFHFPGHISGKTYSKGTLGRLGIEVAAASGWFDPGFQGHGCLFVRNSGQVPVVLRAGMKIGQMVFLLTWPGENTYDGNYQVLNGLGLDRWLPALEKVGKDIRTTKQVEEMLQEAVTV